LGSTLTPADLDAAAIASMPAVAASDDMHASASYRRRALQTLIKRTVAKAAGRSRPGQVS